MQSKTCSLLQTTTYIRSANLSRNLVPSSISPRNPSRVKIPLPLKRLSAMQFPTGGVGRGGGMSQIYHGTAPLSPLPSHFTLIHTTLISYHRNLSPFLAITILINTGFSSPSLCMLLSAIVPVPRFSLFAPQRSSSLS